MKPILGTWHMGPLPSPSSSCDGIRIYASRDLRWNHIAKMIYYPLVLSFKVSGVYVYYDKSDEIKDDGRCLLRACLSL